MSSLNKYLIFAKFITLLTLVSADTYSVKIATDRYVNVVDSKFLSFTVDPKYLFSSSEKYNSKESVCMAAALTPAYIRIAGPSTTHMTFHNATITFTDLDLYEGHSDLEELAITNGQWKKFVKWAKSTGFDLVFALNNEEKTESGLWDPNSALNILTMAEKANIGDMYWQLGFECKNQTIEDYLNDLETLSVIMETFTGAHEWRALGGDVTPCLTADSKSDFKDYVMLSDDMMDALMLNGNSSAQQLERMSDSDRLKLLQYLSTSSTPLWLTETPNPQVFSELLRAADWMTSLGYSARNGFAVHFREMIEDELYEPTLSFYMALLFKNLVGERVLDVDIEASQAVLFAHCTSLRHKPVPGAVTLFGANMDDEPARFSVKMSRREEGGDIMQFILGHDRTGNIVVNGRAMYYEGDIRPVVKRVRPYKTLLLNLPPKSFGFWVIANTKIEACHDTNNSTELVEALSITDDDTVSNSIKTKRSMVNRSGDVIDLSEVVFDGNETEENDSLKKRIDDLNAELDNVHSIFETTGKFKEGKKSRTKRQIFDTENEGIGKLKRLGLKHRQYKNRLSDEPKNTLENLRKLLGLKGRFNHTRLFSHERLRKGSKLGKNVNKRNSQTYKVKTVEKKNSLKENNTTVEDKLSRRRRAILRENHNISSKGKEHEEEIEKFRNHENMIKDQDHKETRNIKHHEQKRNNHNHEETSTENEIDVDSADQAKLWKILRQIHEQLKDLHTEENENVEYVETGDDSKDVAQIIVKTKLSDDAASINVSEKTEGLLKSTIENVLDVLADLNKKLDKVWNVLSILD